ncbi:MAG: DUF92 domain-containing protein, partial [Gemmatimonadales bacterium]
MTWLTGRGAVAALAVGAATLIGTGWRGVALLAAFLVSGSVLTRAAEGAAARRTGRQVLANGGVAALSALVSGRTCERRALPVLAGALAAATADTWATEIGSTASS